MEKYIRLTQPGRAPGSYLRKDYEGDVLYSFYRYKQISMTFAKRPGTTTKVADALAEQLLCHGLITPEQKEAYTNRVCREFPHVKQHDEQSVEQTYRYIHGIRKEMLGIAALEQEQMRKARRGVEFDPSGGIDQRRKKEALLRSCRAVILVLCQAELFCLMQADLEAARQQGKEIYLLVSPDRGEDIPTRQELQQWLGSCTDIRFLEADADGIAWDPDLQERIDRGEACLLVYGEEGLLQCRKLRLDAVVSAIPAGYHAQAVTNQLGCSRACVVYVPKGFDITPWVKLKSQTRLSYWQLAKLWEAYGDGIYELTPEQLYRQYPQYFINIYENGVICPEAEQGYPIIVDGASFVQFDAARERAIRQYLNSFENIQYYSTYFDEELEEKELCWDSRQKQGGILVQGVLVKKAQGARIIQCEKGITPRQMFAGGGTPGTGIVSNFLFFLTPKLGVLYNDLRKDRPREQADAAAGHLDYMLCYREGKRIETFPLFRKTCIAMKENGEFLFFNFRLGGGSIRVSGYPISWTAGDVDVPAEYASVRVYTPYYSLPDREGDRETYRKPVGEGRINLVILQDRICCIRKGNVILPSVGVVVSLEAAAGQALLDSLCLQPLEDSYYDTSGLQLSVRLDPPKEVSPELWKQVKWAYGGGLSLILDGVSLCDSENMEQWFEREGWMSPLSRQTQESVLHQLVKHPRTAIGTTKNGELVILVFSGRTWRSSGADYREMCQIARKLFPDIRCLMNVDGGGSAMLGMVINGSFMELSCPSTSTDSCVGMVRPVNTVFYIPAGDGKK